MTTTVAGLLNYAGYFITAVGLSALFLAIYVQLTPHREFRLITHELNASAALALGMSLLGFIFPLASAILNAVGILDCLIWGLVALLVQILAYFLARLPFPKLSDAIADNSIAAAVWLGFISMAAGILSAACMTP